MHAAQSRLPESPGLAKLLLVRIIVYQSACTANIDPAHTLLCQLAPPLPD